MIEYNTLQEMMDHVTKRFETLFNQLHEIDTRFTFLPKSGFIRFANIVDGTPIGSCAVVSWTGKWAQVYTRPQFAFEDGSIKIFDTRLYPKISTFNWMNDDVPIIGWQHQLDSFCDEIYDDLMQALKKEKEMQKYVKEQDIKKAAKFYEL